MCCLCTSPSEMNTELNSVNTKPGPQRSSKITIKMLVAKVSVLTSGFCPDKPVFEILSFLASENHSSGSVPNTTHSEFLFLSLSCWFPQIRITLLPLLVLLG